MVAGTGTTLRYVNDVSVSNDRVLEEMNTSNVANRINVWGAGGLVSSGGASAAARLYPLTDAQGTTRFLTDSSGNVVQAYSYSPYGQLTSTLSATTTPYLYTGENLDQETGLQYLRARYYDPATGRFISRDPMRGTLTNPITQNPYIYAGDNPTAYVDPSGQQAEEIIEEGLPLLEKVADGCAEGGMAAIRALGQLGQLLSEVEQNSTRIPSITQTATYRIPDGLNESLGLLQEVKNASYQALTKQLIDFLLYAQQNGYIFELYVRSNTALSQPLQGLVNTGAIVLKFLGQ
jgi:RHS repeat-associated protein